MLSCFPLSTQSAITRRSWDSLIFCLLVCFCSPLRSSLPIARSMRYPIELVYNTIYILQVGKYDNNAMRCNVTVTSHLSTCTSSCPSRIYNSTTTQQSGWSRRSRWGYFNRFISDIHSYRVLLYLLNLWLKWILLRAWGYFIINFQNCHDILVSL